jgi:hypothetical protein
MQAMTRARLKTEVQDVWQCDGVFKLGVPRWVFGCTEAREDGLYLVRGADKQRVDRGDYLVRDLEWRHTVDD